jgi:hypothetical protein
MRKQNRTQKNSLLAGKTPAQGQGLGAKSLPSGSYEHRLKAFMVANGMVLADNKEGLSHKDRVTFTDYLCHFHGMTRGGAANALSFEQFLPESLAKRLGSPAAAPAVKAEVMTQAHLNLRSAKVEREAEAETKVEDTTTEDSGSNSQEAGANTEGENNESTDSVESTESTQESEESSTESGDTDSSNNSEE